MKICKKDEWYDDVVYCYEITDEECEMIGNLTIDDIHEHMKQAIGVMTPCGKSKFIPCIMLGKLEISVQINYQLWSLRDDEGRVKDNSPITADEFDKLVTQKMHNCRCWNLDVRMRYDGKPFINATQMSMQDICWELNCSIIG